MSSSSTLFIFIFATRPENRDFSFLMNNKTYCWLWKWKNKHIFLQSLNWKKNKKKDFVFRDIDIVCEFSFRNIFFYLYLESRVSWNSLSPKFLSISSPLILNWSDLFVLQARQNPRVSRTSAAPVPENRAIKNGLERRVLRLIPVRFSSFSSTCRSLSSVQFLNPGAEN